MAKQQTRWLFSYKYSDGRLQVGWIHNLNSSVANSPRDNVRLRWELNGKAVSDLWMRPDEALAMAAGLTCVVGQKVLGEQEYEAQKQHGAGN